MLENIDVNVPSLKLHDQLFCLSSFVQNIEMCVLFIEFNFWRAVKLIIYSTFVKQYQILILDQKCISLSKLCQYICVT